MLTSPTPARAEVPEERRRASARADTAPAEVDRVAAAGACLGSVTADAAHGAGAAFRRRPDAWARAWAVGVSRVRSVYAAPVELP